MPIRLTVTDIVSTTLRILYPNWLTVSYFTENWGLFFSEEVYNLSVLFIFGAAIRYMLEELTLWSVLCGGLWTIGTRRVLAGGLCGSTKDLTGQTVIVTGANTGVGKGTTQELLKRGQECF
ncbi:NAD(P)-binding domain [Trinorchestia longiramus]|nr:NAD(P)-binding domain [Trinorchestia longiramus]